MQYRQVRSIGSGFHSALRGVAVDRHGGIYVAGDSGIGRFDATGAPQTRWTTAKPAWCVETAPDNTVWAGEEGQIEIFDAAGKLKGTWRDQSLFGRVTAIGFTRDGVLAADAAGRAIRHLDASGRLRNDIGTDNPLRGLAIPNGVADFAVDAHGIVYAANPGKHRVERYKPDGERLGHIGKFDQHDPAGFPGCCNPTNVAVREHIYVTEKAAPRAKVYDFAGALLAVIGEGAFDANCKNMSIDVDAHGRVYVADTVRMAIAVFERSLA